MLMRFSKAAPSKEIKGYIKDVVLEELKSEAEFSSWLEEDGVKTKKDMIVEFDIKLKVVQPIYDVFGKSVEITFKGVTFAPTKKSFFDFFRKSS